MEDRLAALVVVAASVKLEVIAGPDDSDPRQRDIPNPEPYAAAVRDASADLAGVRLGLVQECVSSDSGIEPAVRHALDRAVDELTRLGATVIPVDLPEHAAAGPLGFGTTVEGIAALLAAGGNGYQWRGKYWPELAAGLTRGWDTGAARLGTATKAVLIAGSYLHDTFRGEWYAHAQNARNQLCQGYERALTGVDALLAPTTPGLPHTVGAVSDVERARRGWAVLANTAPTNITGHPALSMPLAEADGLPVGVMLTARRFDEPRLLRIAAACEQELGIRPR